MMAAKMEEENLASEEAMFAEMMVMMADGNKRMMLHGEVPDGFMKTTRGLVGYFLLFFAFHPHYMEVWILVSIGVGFVWLGFLLMGFWACGY